MRKRLKNNRFHIPGSHKLSLILLKNCESVESKTESKMMMAAI